MELSVSEPLVAIAAQRVSTLTGELVRVRDQLARGPTVLALVRQFGCLFCHELVSELADAAPNVHARGGSVVIVGSGTLEQGRRFAEAKRLAARGVTLLVDPERATFRAGELPRSYARTFLHPGAADAYARARSEGHRITGVFGDVPQLGALYVVRPPVEAVLAHPSRFAGDHPDMADVLRAVERAAVRSARSFDAGAPSA